MDGFERFAAGQLITVFCALPVAALPLALTPPLCFSAATDYCGTARNAGAILVLGRDLVSSASVKGTSLSGTCLRARSRRCIRSLSTRFRRKPRSTTTCLRAPRQRAPGSRALTRSARPHRRAAAWAPAAPVPPSTSFEGSLDVVENSIALFVVFRKSKERAYR